LEGAAALEAGTIEKSLLFESHSPSEFAPPIDSTFKRYFTCVPSIPIKSNQRGKGTNLSKGIPFTGNKKQLYLTRVSK